MHNESILKLPDVQNNLEEIFTKKDDRKLSEYEIKTDEISEDEETEMSDVTKKDIEVEISDDENEDPESDVPASYRYLCPIADCVYFCPVNNLDTWRSHLLSEHTVTHTQQFIRVKC